MSRRHQRRVTIRWHTFRMRNGSTLRWAEYPCGNGNQFKGFGRFVDAWMNAQWDEMQTVVEKSLAEGRLHPDLDFWETPLTKAEEKKDSPA